MTRLIDADALHKALYTKQKWIVHRNGKHNEGFTSDQVHFAIDEQPTIDAVPVIRCKDCIYFTPEKSGEHWNTCRFYDAPKTADGYCNDAEPKEAE